MGIVQIPAPVAGATRNVVAFTSTQTWTVPSSAKYVDVLVVGGGSGGRGGFRDVYSSDGGTDMAGSGGGVTMMRDIFLNGTGTVSIVVGAGSSGTTGTSTTTAAAFPSMAGYSGFGTFCYSSGAQHQNPGLPGYKGTVSLSPNSWALNNDTNQANWAPLFEFANTSIIRTFLSNAGSTENFAVVQNANAIGLVGGRGGGRSGVTQQFKAGGHPGMSNPSSVTTNIYTNTLAQMFPSSFTAFAGAATAGSSGGGSGAVGAAGQQGFAGGGGTAGFAVNAPGGQGGPGAGGGPSLQASTGTNGGNGGNAGTNTGAGGGGGGMTGSTSAGTGGNGGNGGSGIVIVSWLS